jgi:hypothetical protein
LFEFGTSDDPSAAAVALEAARVHRRRIALAGGAVGLGVVVILAVLFLGGGGAELTAADPSSASAAERETPAATPRPTMTPRPSSAPAPTSSPSVMPSSPAVSSSSSSFAFNNVLRVEVDGLAVRRAIHAPAAATGWTWDRQSLTWNAVGGVRLNAGEFVSVDLGPLQIGDATWYRVWPAEGGQLHYSTVVWDTQNNGANPGEPGWVAASVGPDAYLTLYQAF